MYERPYAVGFVIRGVPHAKCCDCGDCAPMRAKAFKKWFNEQARLPAMPDMTRTVFVKPHWRRQRNHLKNQPMYRRALIRAFL